MAERDQPYDPYIPSGGQGGAAPGGNQRTAALQAVRDEPTSALHLEPEACKWGLPVLLPAVCISDSALGFTMCIAGIPAGPEATFALLCITAEPIAPCRLKLLFAAFWPD